MNFQRMNSGIYRKVARDLSGRNVVVGSTEKVVRGKLREISAKTSVIFGATAQVGLVPRAIMNGEGLVKVPPSNQVAKAGELVGGIGDEAVLQKKYDKSDLSTMVAVGIDLKNRLKRGDALNSSDWAIVDFLKSNKNITIEMLNNSGLKGSFNLYHDSRYAGAEPALFQIDDLLLVGGAVKLGWKGMAMLSAKFTAKIGGGRIGKFTVDQLLKSGLKHRKNGFTEAGGALQKHANRVGDIFSKFKPNTGKAVDYNRKGQEVLKDILNSREKLIRTRIIKKNGKKLELLEIFMKKGLGEGVSFWSNGTIKGFINPIKK